MNCFDKDDDIAARKAISETVRGRDARELRLAGLLLCGLAIFGTHGCNRSPDVSVSNSGESTISQTAQLGDTANRSPVSHVDGETLGSLDRLEKKQFDATIRDIVARENPVIDGWSTEHFSALADKQLKLIGSLLTEFTAISDADLSSIGADAYHSTALRPSQLTTVFEESGTRVLRAEAVQSETHHGIDGFRSALMRLAEPLTGATHSHFKFKTIRVEREGDYTKTRCYFEISGRTNASTVQINATWDCEWKFASDDKLPRLRRVKVSDYEEVVAEDRNGLQLFSDCTIDAFQGLPVLDDQFVHGRDYWYGNLEATIGVEGRGNGIAIGDVNGDGLDDIYFCQPAALPNRLFVRQNDGTMLDVAAQSGVDWLDSTRAALFSDLDNDGDQDLVLTHSTTIVVQENDGSGKFSVRETIETQSRLFSINAVDYNSDGYLDLFICGYSSAANARPEDVFVSPVPYHDANNGGPNFLFRNGGDWSFDDVTSDVGLDSNNLRFSLASSWDDFDNDGDLDLYVANDFGRNNLYRNDDGKFVDIAKSAGVEDIGPGMSATWNDFNNDGLVDLYVSNMFSSAGSRITHNAQFKPGADEHDIEGFRRHARGNSLFRNDGREIFVDQSVAAGVTMGRWAWGSLFVDFNNDGWRDIYVANGFVTADNNNDL